jgi:hypothetical protein
MGMKFTGSNKRGRIAPVLVLPDEEPFILVALQSDMFPGSTTKSFYTATWIKVNLLWTSTPISF